MKRFLCALAVAALLIFCVSCGSQAASSSQSVATAAPTESSSRNVRSEPVAVSETVANAGNVSGTEAPAPTQAPEQAEETPSTGDIPVAYIAAILGLILVCSAGLIMLKRI
ncbi:MAG: hypothetical protein PUA63_01135 [Oscillospiraceae bacterium]|nr:hypothetical protein [Oscillospiraceae bacterium]